MNWIKVILLIITELPHLLPVLKSIINEFGNQSDDIIYNDLKQAMLYYDRDKNSVQLETRLKAIEQKLLGRNLKI